mgnify:CR=1 FL=1
MCPADGQHIRSIRPPGIEQAGHAVALFATKTGHAGDADILADGGGKGADILDGGAGRDVLVGGRGADVFMFSQAPKADKIKDFKSGVDQVDMSNLGDVDVSIVERKKSFAVKVDMNGDGFFDDGTLIVVADAFSESDLVLA